MNTRKNSANHVLVTAALARSIQKVMDEEGRSFDISSFYVDEIIAEEALFILKNCKALPQTHVEEFDEIMADYGWRFAKGFGGLLDDDAFS